MLLPPQYIINIIAPKEAKTLFNNRLFPSVPERTKRNFIKDKSKPNQKTLELIYSDIQETTSLNLDQTKNLFSSTAQPWQCTIDMCKMGFKNSSGEELDKCFDYAISTITSIEACTAKIAKSIKTKDPNWQSHIEDLNLPTTICTKELINRINEVIYNKKSKEHTNEPGIKFCLNLTLYSVASFEISLINSCECAPDQMPFIQKLLPSKDNGTTSPPMHKFFINLMKKLECHSIDELAHKLPSLTKPKSEIDYDSQARQIRRWMSGEPMSWELVLAIRDKFFQHNDGICITYAAARLLQALFKDVNKLIPTIFNSEDEVIELFQKYPSYQAHHAAHFNN